MWGSGETETTFLSAVCLFIYQEVFYDTYSYPTLAAVSISVIWLCTVSLVMFANQPLYSV